MMRKEILNMDPNKRSSNNGPRQAKPIVLLRHMVLFKFKDDSTPEQVRAIEIAFCALPSKINAVYEFEWGTNVGDKDKSQGFTHCFLVTFRSEADRDTYLPHQAHKEFHSVLFPHLEKHLVVDYWTKA
jgi:hypothetical protein